VGLKNRRGGSDSAEVGGWGGECPGLQVVKKRVVATGDRLVAHTSSIGVQLQLVTGCEGGKKKFGTKGKRHGEGLSIAKYGVKEGDGNLRKGKGG